MASVFPDYPFESHWFDIDGQDMHYIDEGPRQSGADALVGGDQQIPFKQAHDAAPNSPRHHASTVLMVHGNPTWSYYYRRLITALAPDHRVIAPDHIGMGLSDKPNDAHYNHTLARRVADLEKLLVALRPRGPITLVVHDWGGMIGAAWAVRHPEMIARIVVLNTGAFRLPATKKMPWQLKLSRMPFLGALLVRGFNAFARGATTQCVARPMPRDVARAFVAPYDAWSHRRAVHRFIQDIPLSPRDPAWQTVADTEAKLHLLRHVPMLICWGAHDFVFDDHFLRRWQELFPAAAIHRFADAGHYVLEDAHERIIPLVKEFVDARAEVGAP